MADAVQIVLGFGLLVGVFLFSQWLAALRIRRACRYVVEDLEAKQALDMEKALELPYARRSLFRIGMKDFRPKALQSLAAAGIVGQTADGKYYLLKKSDFSLRSK